MSKIGEAIKGTVEFMGSQHGVPPTEQVGFERGRKVGAPVTRRWFLTKAIPAALSLGLTACEPRPGVYNCYRSELLDTKEGRSVLSRLQGTYRNLQECGPVGGNGNMLNLISACSKEYGVNPGLIWAVYTHESHGLCDAVSSTGAKGAGQFVQGTWDRMSKKFLNVIHQNPEIMSSIPDDWRQYIQARGSTGMREYLKSGAVSNVALNVLYSSDHLFEDCKKAYRSLPADFKYEIVAWQWSIIAYHIGWGEARWLMKFGNTPEIALENPRLPEEWGNASPTLSQIKRHYKDIVRLWPFADAYVEDQACVSVKTSNMPEFLTPDEREYILNNVYPGR